MALLGRVDDLINTKGKKVNPREIEQVLRQVPGVDDVAVLGIPRPGGGGELIRAFVAAPGKELDYEELRRWCRERLADFKVPRSFIFLPALPRNERGKLDRQSLKALPPMPPRP